MAEGTYSADQVDQLLKCPVCLDRFNQPKILPCQHTFCRSCLEHLIDMRSRILKCPECRTEHFISFQGVDAFPTNITISGFLDLPTQNTPRNEASSSSSGVSGDAAAAQSNSANPESAVVAGSATKCGVCEKDEETVKCFHCNKLVCASCKQSHTGQMKLDIGRLVNQIRRTLPKLSNCISDVDQRSEQVKSQVEGVRSEIKSTIARLVKELQDREKLVNSELDTFLLGEQRSLRIHRENVEVELASVSSYCDATEGLLNQEVVPEADMVSTKSQCSQYMTQIREIESNPVPTSRRINFTFQHQPITGNIASFGELVIVNPETPRPSQPTPTPTPSASAPQNTTPASTSRNTAPNTNNSNRNGNSTGAAAPAQRARWSDSNRLDASYFERFGIFDSPDPNPAQNYRSLDQGVASAMSNYRSPRADIRPPNRARSDTVYRAPNAGGYGANPYGPTPSTHGVLPNRRPPNTRGYMFNMDTSTDNILEWLEYDRAESESTTGNRSSMAQVFGNPRNQDNRPAGFLGGGGGAAGTSRISPRRLAPVDRPAGMFGGGGGGGIETVSPARRVVDSRPAAAFIVPLDGSEPMDITDGGGNGENTSSQPIGAAHPLPPRPNRGRQNNARGRGNGRNNRPQGNRPNPVQVVRRPNATGTTTGANGNTTGANRNTTGSTGNTTSSNGNTTGSNGNTTGANPTGASNTNNNSGLTNVAGVRNGTEDPPARPERPQRSGTFVQEAPSTSQDALPNVTNNGTSFNVSLADDELNDIEMAAASNDNAQASTSSNTNGNTPSRPLINYHTKGQLVKKLGRASNNANGNFKCPRGVALSPITESLVVADSSNHRVQMFDCNGQFVKAFGSYGQEDGEFDCLAGIAVNTMGQIVIADRYNHRIQVFDRYGNFSHKFGSEGTSDGQMSYPWGVAVDNSGFIYVCDKENHRIQVFTQSGRFVRKFGTLGSRPSQMENPHFVTVSHDNKVYISDTNNHRVQVFTNTGRLVRTIGSEGARNGQLKYPKGVAVDRQGFVIVADSGNHRIQIFKEDGQFYCGFGSEGAGEGQFKSIEGLCVTNDGKVIASDNKKHVVQMF